MTLDDYEEIGFPGLDDLHFNMKDGKPDQVFPGPDYDEAEYTGVVASHKVTKKIVVILKPRKPAEHTPRPRCVPTLAEILEYIDERIKEAPDLERAIDLMDEIESHVHSKLTPALKQWREIQTRP